MFTHLLGAGIILCPIILRLVDPTVLNAMGLVSSTRLSKDIFFYTFIILLSLFWKKNKQAKNLAIYLSIVLFYFFINTGIFAHIFWWTQFQMVSISVLFFYIIVTSEIKIDLLMKYILASGLICSIWCILNTFDIELYKVFLSPFYEKITIQDYQPGGVGPLGNTMLSGAFIALCAPSLFSGKKHFLLAPIYLWGVITTNSAMALASFVTVFIYYLIKIDKFIFLGLFILAGMLLPFLDFTKTFFSDNDRFSLWAASLKYMRSYIFGNGLGDYPLFIPQFISIDQHPPTQMHNEFLELYYSSGQLGVILIGALIYFSLSSTKNKIIIAGILATLVNCYGNFTFHISPLSMIGLIYIGIGLKECRYV